MVYHILGLGDSLKKFDGKPGEPTIGVNDIFSRREADYLLCIDPPRVFPLDRLAVIKDSRPKKFYTNLPEFWIGQVPGPVEIIELAKPKGDLSKLDSGKFVHSICSPYVAAVLAYKLGAKEIILWGVDLFTHDKFNSNNERVKKIISDFVSLEKELHKRGVRLYVGNSNTALFPALTAKVHNITRLI